MSAKPWNGIIETKALPARCPSCAKKDPAVSESRELHTVSCVCGWSAKYELVAEVSR